MANAQNPVGGATPTTWSTTRAPWCMPHAGGMCSDMHALHIYIGRNFWPTWPVLHTFLNTCICKLSCCWSLMWNVIEMHKCNGTLTEPARTRAPNIYHKSRNSAIRLKSEGTIYIVALLWLLDYIIAWGYSWFHPWLFTQKWSLMIVGFDNHAVPVIC